MDPVMLTTLFGSAAITWMGIQKERSDRAEDREIVLRRLFDTSDGWIATELLSAEALNATSQILNTQLLQWWPKVKGGFYKVVVLAQPGGPLERQVVLILASAGRYGWFLSEAFCPGFRRVTGRLNYQRIEALLNSLNRDPADEVVNTAAKIFDLNQRYAYLKRALTANPQLSALLSVSEPFLEITRATVKQVDPETYERVESRRAEQELRRDGEQMMRALPLHEVIDPDFEIRTQRLGERILAIEDLWVLST